MLGAVGTLGEELRRLRRGRGVMASDLRERLGPGLRAMAGIDADDDISDVRERLIAFLEELAVGLPEDLRTAFAAALAIREDVRYRFLDERMRWLADWLDRDMRTARRRADEAIRLIEASASGAAGTPGDYGDWHLARLRTLLLLDRAEPSAIEERTVVAARDDLTEVVIATSIPRPQDKEPAGPGREHNAELEVLYGGSLVARDWPTATYFRYVIRLAHPLRRGQAHEFGVSLTIPRGQPFKSRYAFQPLRRCDEFDLRIRFGATAQAKCVWRISGLPRGMVDDFADPEALVCSDATGDIRLRYRHLRVGLAYGARWPD